MLDFYALTGTPLPPALHGADAGFAVRALFHSERLAIEDHFFGKNTRLATLTQKTTAITAPHDHTGNCTLAEFGILTEFALAVLTTRGFHPVSIVAAFNGATCVEGVERPHLAGYTSEFPKRLLKTAASTWIRHVFQARRKLKDKLHVTADRFVRYSRITNSSDALLDLCICLESLIESQTDISFRFAACLAKITGLDNAAEISDLLSDLYDLRSKIVHGADPAKAHIKIQPHASKIRLVARAALTSYILFLTEHSQEDWKKHLRHSLFM
jgi:hypothetical protein